MSLDSFYRYTEEQSKKKRYVPPVIEKPPVIVPEQKTGIYSSMDKRLGGVLPGGSDFVPADYGISDKFAENNPAISRGLATLVSPLKVLDNPYLERASQAGNEVRFLTENPDKVDTGSNVGNTVADFIGGATGFIGGSPGSIMPSAGGALFGAGAKATGKVLPQTTKPILRTAGEMAGGSVVYDLANSAANDREVSAKDIGVVAAQNALLGATTYGLGRAAGKLLKDRTETPLIEKDITSPEVKADIPADLNGARNILQNTTNFGRATRILDAYPALGAEFPQFRLKQGDKVILPNEKEATVKNADRLIIQAEVDGKTVSVGRKVVKIPENKVEVPEVKIQEVLQKQLTPDADIPIGEAIWDNGGVDYPVNIIGSAGSGKDGRQYVNIEGSNTAIPLDEIRRIDKMPRETRSGAEILPDENIMQAESQTKSMAEDIGLKPEKAETETKVDTTTQENVDGPERAGYYDPGTIGAARLTPPETINTIASKTDKPVLTERLAPSNVGNMIKKVYYRTVDGYNRLNDFDKAANGSGRTIPFNKRAYILAHNTTNAEAMARRTLEENMVNAKGEPIYAPLKDIVKQVPKGEWRKFEDYLKLKHYKAWENSDMTVYDREINMSPEMADLKISKYDNKYSWMDQAAKDYTAWINKFGEEWLVKTGLLSENVWNAMRSKYGDYIPLQRMMEEVEIGKTGVKGSFADQPNPVKRARGSERKTIESLETMLERVPNYIKAAKRNEVMQKVIEGIRQDPEGMSIWGEIVDSNTANLTMPNIVAGRINGERVHVRVNDLPLLEAISGLTPQAQNVIINAARSLTSKMKLLTTGINPIFSLGRNVVRDLPMSYVASKSTNNPIEWSKDIVGALLDILGNKAAYRSYKDMGGGYASAVSTDINVLSGSKAKLMPGYYDLNNIKNPVEYTRRLLGVPFKALEKLADVTEAVPRLGEYRRIIRKEGDSYATRTKALYESKDVTVNFQKKNTAEITNLLDTFIPYFGASINGLDKLARIYKDNPVAAIGKTFAAITIPTLMLYSVNHNNPDYQKLSSWVKDTNHLIPLPNGTFLKFPKPREGGVVFGALVERTLDSLQNDNPDAFYKFMDTFKASFLWPTRTIIAPREDLRANKDFIGRPIVPKYMEGMSPGQQYDEKTSSFAKMLGEFNPEKISPKQVDYLVKSYLGVIGQIGIPALSEGSAGDALKRIFTADSAYSSDTIQKFYDKKKKYDTIKADAKQTGDAINPNDEKFRKLYGKVAEMISDNSNQARELRKNKDILEKQKDKQLKDIQLKTLVLADIVNRPVEEQLKVYNDLKRKKYITEEKPKSESKTKAEQKRQQKRNDAIGKIISE